MSESTGSLKTTASDFKSHSDMGDIKKCINKLQPFHGLLLIAERKRTLEKLPQNVDSSFIRLVDAYNPTKNLKRLSADANLTLNEVFNIVTQLIYWDVAVLIFPLAETNMYAVSSKFPTKYDSTLVNEFEKQFPEYDLSKTVHQFSTPTSIQHIMGFIDKSITSTRVIEVLIWLLQHKILTQFHTYVYFGSTAENINYSTVLEKNQNDNKANVTYKYQMPVKPQLQLLEEYKNESMSSMAIRNMHLPVSHNPQNFSLLMEFVNHGYLTGKYHIEEIAYFENIKSSYIYQLLDNFQDVLFTIEMEDPIISNLY